MMHLTYLKYTANKLLLFTAALMITLVACEGPAGSEGPQGPKGEVGAIGPAGEDGSQMYAGKGAPAGDIGKEGDYYLNNVTGELYGPKNENGWGTPISLQGPPGDDGQDGDDGKDGQDGNDGADGQDGSQIYSGTTAPSVFLGKAGDFYLNTATFDLYGPKNPKKKNSWGTPINLKGTANVMYSSWIGLNNAKRDTIIDASRLKVTHIETPQISQEILDQGIVMVYMKVTSSIFPLPYTSYSGSTPNVIDFLPRLNKLLITRFTLDNSGSIGFAPALDFRYVIIPGGVPVSSNLSKEQLRQMSYDEVKLRFGIRK